VPIAVRITPSNMTRDDYETIMKQLQETGSGDPEGRTFHAAFGEDEVHMFDVWESQEAFQPHHDNLMNLLQGAGIDGGIVQIETIHNTVNRP
jgi:quinol monooxygenase YgiN